MSKNTYKNLFSLKGKVALVTGGVGIIGTELCNGLADAGASVAIADINETRASELAQNLTSEYKVKSLAVKCDVSSPESVIAMIETVEKQLGPIDVLLNNAAFKSSDLDAFFAPIETSSLDMWQEVMSVNLNGVFLVAREVGSRMALRGKGSIVQTASIYGLVAPDQRIYKNSYYLGRQINTPAVYSASKAGVIGLTKYLATYWGEKGVRVNTLTPGGVKSGQNEQFIENYSARVPLGRMAEANDMVGAAIFLSSDASAYVTGQNIVVDGGLSVW